jgi:hypothetical protein
VSTRLVVGRRISTAEEAAMGRLVVTDSPKSSLDVVEPRARHRITAEEIEKGLGGKRIATVPSGGSPTSAYAVRQEIYRREIEAEANGRAPVTQTE